MSKIGIIGSGTMTVSFRKDNENLDQNRPIYECSVCGKLFNWNKDSWWYGSLRDSEVNPDKLKYFCSDKCVQTSPGAEKKRKNK